MQRLLCVYCASSDHLEAKYHAAAAELGRGMVARGWGLVYGGGHIGLMGVVARAVKAGGGRVVGIIPDFMISRELAYDGADELVTVATMRERKRLMEERAAAFVTLPGGIGTLEEFAEIVTLRYLRRLDKPVVLVNQDGFYDDLLKFFARMAQERFTSARAAGLFAVTKNVEEIWPLLERTQPFEADALWR
ncbi:MAG TPA: TIGR00730 family Rossman fold protein [Opitutaceae bacterium]|nr:TIGR00730 family Rossman fold protein [Opitutaceae bacterium]